MCRRAAMYIAAICAIPTRRPARGPPVAHVRPHPGVPPVPRQTGPESALLDRGVCVCYTGTMDALVWHILRVSPGKEKEVQNALTSTETYVPIRHMRRFNRRLRVTTFREEPLYPGYVFAKTNAVQSLLSVPCSSLLGIVRSMDREYAVLSDEKIDLVRLVEADIERASQVKQKEHSWTIGQKVRMKAFPLINVLVAGLQGKYGVLVNLDIFGATRTIRVEASQIEAIVV